MAGGSLSFWMRPEASCRPVDGLAARFAPFPGGGRNSVPPRCDCLTARMGFADPYGQGGVRLRSGWACCCSPPSGGGFRERALAEAAPNLSRAWAKGKHRILGRFRLRPGPRWPSVLDMDCNEVAESGRRSTAPARRPGSVHPGSWLPAGTTGTSPLGLAVLAAIRPHLRAGCACFQPGRRGRTGARCP